MAAPLGGRGAPHRPVLLRETIEFLAANRGGLFIDCTLGLGGHTEAILEAAETARVIGIDRDREAIAFALERLEPFGSRFQAVHANFRELTAVLENAGYASANGILVDLGASSLQLDSESRGFSFRFDAPLDMRMNAGSDEATAAELLAQLPQEEIARLIFEYGEERRSRRIAKFIVNSRERGEAINTTELAEIVIRAIGRRPGDRIHPATRTFQALRIAVNRELEGLDQFAETAIDLLQPEGRFVAISFHSLEDRIIKQTLRRLSGRCECPPRMPQCSCGARRTVQILTRRPVVPGEIEIAENPRARSAKLRACRKLPDPDV
ncbi:MAG: rRNA (cytosine1402-N4)-methyltransferase [Blastocatellia bacterium]|nr:rRNA (cytosine1402-N4)-methyltransferase [Blastocatellia bacterium]